MVRDRIIRHRVMAGIIGASDTKSLAPAAGFVLLRKGGQSPFRGRKRHAAAGTACWRLLRGRAVAEIARRPQLLPRWLTDKKGTGPYLRAAARYSYRSAFIGSIFDARSAGMNPA